MRLERRPVIHAAALLFLLAASVDSPAADQPIDHPPQIVRPSAEVLPDLSLEELSPDPVKETDNIVENMRSIIDHPLTIAVVHSFVVETEAVLFKLPEDDPELGPRFDMYTRVVADVHRSFKKWMPERIEFWLHGGVIEETGERIIGQPYAIFTSEDIRIEPGDEVLACIQSHRALPNGDLVLMLRGSRHGVSFPNSQNDINRRVGQTLHDYLLDHYSDAR